MLLSLALLAAAPIVQEAQPAAEPPKKERRTCRRVGMTGSRMDDKRICKTKSEWAAIDAANAGYGVDRDHSGELERNRAK